MVGAQGGDIVLVAHSGANALVSVIVDRHPEIIRCVIWVDFGPVSSVRAFTLELPKVIAEVPLPTLDIRAEQASLEGLSPDDSQRFPTMAIPEPGPFARETVCLTNQAHRSVSTTLVYCSISQTQVIEFSKVGHPCSVKYLCSSILILSISPRDTGQCRAAPRELAKVISGVALRLF